MKTQILVLLVSLFSVVAFGSNVPYTISGLGKSIVVNTSAWKTEKVNIQITDIQGVIILDETVKSVSSLRKYNLKNLPNGAYQVVISNQLKATTQDFFIEGNNTIVSTSITTSFKPIISLTKSDLDINYMVLNQNATISLFDNDNNQVFEEEISGPAIHKRYDISKLADGNYVVVVKSKNQSFSKSIVK